MNTKELVEALDRYPELKANIEELIKVASNSGGNIELADEAEERLLALSPKLNKTVLQTWAETQATQKSRQFESRHKGARKDIKKN